MSTQDRPMSLEAIDALMRSAYQEVRRQLAAVEENLQALETEREQLALRASKLAHGLGLAPKKTTPAPAPTTPPTTPPTTQAKPEPAKAEPAKPEPAKAEPAKAEPAKPEPTKAVKPAPETPKKPKKAGKRGRKPGPLWKSVRQVLKKNGTPMRAKEVIEALLEKNPKAEDNLGQKVYNSLGRWHREGKLEKHGHGTYGLK